MQAGINVTSSTTTGLFGPAHMPPELVKRLHDAVVPLHAMPDFREKLAAISMTPYQASSQQFAATIAAERKRFDQLVKAGTVREGAYDQRSQEFSRIDERLTGRRHRFGYAIGLAGHATVEIVDRVFYALERLWGDAPAYPIEA